MIEAAVWNERARIPVTGKGRQRNTIAGMERLSEETGVVAHGLPLAEILAGVPDLDYVDLLFVTVNGAEVEALERLGEWFDRVGSAHANAPYSTRQEGPNVELVRDLLKRNGFSLVPSGHEAQVFATREGR